MEPIDIVKLPAHRAAPLLLGQILESHHDGRLVRATISEVEAYEQTDPASHTYRGQTKRNQAMFSAGGVAYVYFTYGMHYCLNIVCGQAGVGQGVLVRGVNITAGWSTALERRYPAVDQPTKYQLRNISNGPGKVVQALGVSMADYGQSFFAAGSSLKLLRGELIDPADIQQTPRIGISRAQDTLWRWHI